MAGGVRINPGGVNPKWLPPPPVEDAKNDTGEPDPQIRRAIQIEESVP